MRDPIQKEDNTNKMAHTKTSLQRPQRQLVRRREHTPDKHTSLELVEMLR